MSKKSDDFLKKIIKWEKAPNDAETREKLDEATKRTLDYCKSIKKEKK